MFGQLFISTQGRITNNANLSVLFLGLSLLALMGFLGVSEVQAQETDSSESQQPQVQATTPEGGTDSSTTRGQVLRGETLLGDTVRVDPKQEDVIPPGETLKEDPERKNLDRDGNLVPGKVEPRQQGREDTTSSSPEQDTIEGAQIEKDPPNAADLVVRDITWSPDPAQMSEEVTVDVTIGNEGNASATDRTVNYYLSKDADLNTSGDNVKVGDDVFSISASDITESVTFTPENFSGLEAGDWYVIAEFPSENEFYRFNDKTLTLEEPGGANLVVRDITWSPDPAQLDEEVTVDVTIGNEGSGSATDRTVNYYLSKDADLNTSGDNVKVGDDVFSISTSDITESVTFTPEDVSGLEAGDWYVIAEFPSENEFWRFTDETLKLGEPGGVNLVARDISWSPDPADLDEEVTVDVTIGNDGSGSATDRTVNYYLSKDADLNTSGDNVKVGDNVFSISTSDITESVTFTPENFSGLEAGDWYVIAEFPSENEFWRDTDETLRLEPVGDPDIRISTNSLSFTLPSGDSNTKSFTIENTGNADLDWSISLGESSTSKSGDVASTGDSSTKWAELRTAARKQGKVPVIVYLDVRAQPEGILSKSAVRTQREAISQAQESVVDALTQAGATTENVRRYNTVPYVALHTDESGIDALAGNPDVKRVVRDKPEPPMLEESIPIVGADDAWSAGYSGQGQAVGILDTGVDSNHPALSGKVQAEACYSNGGGAGETVCPNGGQEHTGSGSAQPCDTEGCDHGTHVAGIAAGSGNLQGVAKDADIIAVQVFTKFTGDVCRDSDQCVLSYRSDQIAALEFIYQNRNSYDIASVNMSLGGDRFESPCTADPRAQIVGNLRSAGIVTVSSSGNEGFTEAMGTPACIPSVVSVGSTGDGSLGTTKDAVSSFSNSADFLDLLAPGSVIESSVPGGGYENKGGTSMAAPHVAGAWAVYKSQNANAQVEEVLDALTGSGVPITDSRNGITTPRLQVDQALETESWIAFDPASGVLAPNNSRSVQVSADASGLDAGDYTEVLEIASNDPDESSVQVTVSLTVEGGTAPSVTDDSDQTPEGQPVTTDVLANDSDPDGSIDPATVRVEGSPSDGTASVNDDGTITYDPNDGFAGTDTYTYTVADGQGNRSDPATVTISVEQAPTVSFQLSEETVAAGGTARVEASVNGFTDVTTAQFTVNWDPSVAEFGTVTDLNLEGLSEGNFGTPDDSDISDGALTLSWNDPDAEGVSVEDGTVIFAIEFTGVGSTGDETDVSFGDDPTPRSVSVGGESAIFEGTNGSVRVSETINIAGTVQYYSTDQPTVSDTDVQLSGNADQSVTTGSDGTFEFSDLSSGDYTLTPSRTSAESSASSGISTLDILLIRRDILGLESLGGPHRRLAADLNVSNSIETLDILLARQVILGLSTSLPNGFWRFVPSDHTFDDPSSPWSAPVARDYTSLTESKSEQDFTAVKRGDVNASWTSSSGTAVTASAQKSNQKSAGQVRLDVTDQSASKGDTVRVPVQVRATSKMAGLQFTVQWNPDRLSFVGASNYSLTGMSTKNLATEQVGSGKLPVAWTAPSGKGKELSGEQPVMNLRFRVEETGRSNIQFASEPTPVRAYGGRELSTFSLDTSAGTIEGKEKVESFQLSSNHPNPVRQRTTFEYALPEPESVTFEVYNVLGQLVETHSKRSQEAGRHTITIDVSDLSSGVYMVRMKAGSFAETRKMVLAK